MSARISGGKERGRRLRSPKGTGIRPTSERVRAAIFSMLGPAVEGARVLDIYAGTGAFGMEALSRGAVWADFVEADERHCQAIRLALQDLGMTDIARVYRARAERGLEMLPGGYDLVFADPPYDQNPWDEFLSRMGYRDIVKPGAAVVAEHRHTRLLNDEYGPLKVAKRRRYGDSAVTIFRMEPQHG
jgi:16S rRNA (guanine966-N2)-methyltransferase